MSDEQRLAAMERLLREIKFDPAKRGADETFVYVGGECITVQEWGERYASKDAQNQEDHDDE